MGEVFVKLLNMSLAASWLILAVCLLRLLLKRAPRWLICGLWGLVAVRLICPVAIESEISLIPSAEPIQIGETRPAEPFDASNSAAPAATIGQTANGTVNGQVGNTLSGVPDSEVLALTGWNVAGLVWLVGICAVLGIALFHFIKLRKSLREAIPLWGNIWICDAVASPFILGIARPQIYLPSSMDGTQMEAVIAHERAHIKRLDPFWKLLGYLLLAVYWFNPLCWLAYQLFCKDIELACDERVIRTLPLSKKKEYCRALLAVSSGQQRGISYPLAFGEVGVKDRVKKVLDYKKPKFWVILAALLLCALVCVCFLTNPKGTPAEDTLGIGTEAAGTESIVSTEDGTNAVPVETQSAVEQGQTAGEAFTDEELRTLAGFYYRIHSANDHMPSAVEIDSRDGDIVRLHLYDNLEDHSATLAWYEVDRSGRGEETVTFEEVDLSEARFFLELEKDNENLEIPCLYADAERFIFSAGETSGSMGVFSGGFYVYNRRTAEIEAQADLTDIPQFVVIGQNIYYQKYRNTQSSYGDGLYRTDFSLKTEEAVSQWLSILWYDKTHDVIFAAKQSETEDYRCQLVVIDPDGNVEAVLFDPAADSEWEFGDYDKIQYSNLAYDGSAVSVTVQQVGYREGVSVGWRDAVLDEERLTLPYEKP